MSAFLEVKNLNVAFPTEDGEVLASNDVSYSVALGETLAIVGESGSGKSVANLAVMGLHNPARTKISGSAILNLETGPVDVINADKETVRRLRGSAMSMIFQDPMSALHPFYTVGDQIQEAWSLYNEGGKDAARKRALEVLDLVGIPDVQKRIDEYPHQFSGGMRQRVMIAMALVNNPKLLIADEPTTALDVTVQSQILQLLRDLQKEFNTAIVLITHDMGVVAEMSDRVNVMYAGRVVESGTTDEIFYHPSHPYGIGLLSSIPRIDKGHGKRLHAIPGQPPSLIHLPQGCPFAPRCEFKQHVTNGACESTKPGIQNISDTHYSRCHIAANEMKSLLEAR